jgi:hypothetical protein
MLSYLKIFKIKKYKSYVYSYLFLILFLATSCSGRISHMEAFSSEINRQNDVVMHYELLDYESLPNEVKKDSVRTTVGAVVLKVATLDQEPRYKLFRRSLNELTYLGDFWADDEGRLVSKERKFLDSYYYPYTRCLEGQWFDFAIVKNEWFEDEKVAAMVRITPRKKEVFGENGKHLYLELASENAEIYLLRGEGYSYHQDLYIELQANGEVLQSLIKADEKGEFKMALNSRMEEIYGGKGSVRVSPVDRNAGEALLLEFNWGISAFEETKQFYNTIGSR